MWVGAPGTPKQNRIGLLNLSPEKVLWDFALPGPGIDGTGTVARDPHDRRAHPRFKTTNSVEIHPEGQGAHSRPNCGLEHRRMFHRNAQSASQGHADKNWNLGE